MGSVAWNLKEAGSFTELECLVILKQMLEAVKYLHDILICHRDITADSFILEATCPGPLSLAVLKMVGFANACDFCPGEELQNPLDVDTPHYIAPEVLDGPYTESCDVWSC